MKFNPNLSQLALSLSKIKENRPHIIKNTTSIACGQLFWGNCVYVKKNHLFITHMFQIKTPSNGRWPQHIKSRISQQPMVDSYQYLKVKLRWPNWTWQMLKWSLMEDNLKILKVLFLSIHCYDLIQIWDLSLGVKTNILNDSNKRQIEDYLTIIQVE